MVARGLDSHAVIYMYRMIVSMVVAFLQLECHFDSRFIEILHDSGIGLTAHMYMTDKAHHINLKLCKASQYIR